MTTAHRLREIIRAHFGLPDADMPEDLGSVDLRSDFKADSLDLVELLMEVENEFAIEISDREAERAMGENGDRPLSELVALVEGLRPV